MHRTGYHRVGMAVVWVRADLDMSSPLFQVRQYTYVFLLATQFLPTHRDPDKGESPQEGGCCADSYLRTQA